MLFTSRAIAGAVIRVLAAAVLSAPALAQTPPPSAKAITDFDDLSEQQQDELYCVYDAIADDKDAQAFQDFVVLGEKNKEALANAVFDRSEAACKTKHKWNDDQTEVASVLAKAGVMSDLMESQLRSNGFDDKKFEALMGVSKKMTQPDFQALLEKAYGKKPDAAFMTRMKGLLYEAGVPKNEDLAEIAIGFLGYSLQERDAIFIWLEEQFY